VTNGGGIRAILDNVGAGHDFPSGASQDRRVWVEIIAYKGSNVIFQSGVVPDGTSPTALTDPNLWLLRDCLFDASGKQVSMFWQAASYETNQLPAPVTLDAGDPRFYQTHVVQTFPRGTATLPQMPDRVSMRLRVQPIGRDVLDDLVASGDLDPKLREAMPTMDLGTPTLLEWTAAAATLTYVEAPFQVACVSNAAFNVTADKVPATDHVRCKP
jgi:hypothetical protein